jgi:hypothetical protein
MSHSWLSPDVESGKQDGNNWAEDAPAADADYSGGVTGTAATSTTPSSSETTTSKRGCSFWVNMFIAIVFAILFIVAASVEWNDVNRAVMWGIFYICHAVLALVGVLRMCMCKSMLTKPILLTSAAMLIWSIVLLSLAAVDLSKSVKGGETQGGDSNRRTYREEIGYELGGSILGCLSCIYFFCMCMCCDKAPSNSD